MRTVPPAIEICGGSTRRRFYLTGATFAGNQANNLGNCASGVHFASLWEIREPSLLHYETLLGQTLADSGRGAPHLEGWIRTPGNASMTGGLTAGRADCNAWTDPSLEGSTAHPANSWSLASERVSFWETSTSVCTDPLPIWCVEN